MDKNPFVTIFLSSSTNSLNILFLSKATFRFAPMMVLFHKFLTHICSLFLSHIFQLFHYLKALKSFRKCKTNKYSATSLVIASIFAAFWKHCPLRSPLSSFSIHLCLIFEEGAYNCFLFEYFSETGMTFLVKVLIRSQRVFEELWQLFICCCVLAFLLLNRPARFTRLCLFRCVWVIMLFTIILEEIIVIVCLLSQACFPTSRKGSR